MKEAKITETYIWGKIKENFSCVKKIQRYYYSKEESYWSNEECYDRSPIPFNAEVRKTRRNKTEITKSEYCKLKNNLDYTELKYLTTESESILIDLDSAYSLVESTLQKLRKEYDKEIKEKIKKSLYNSILKNISLFEYVTFHKIKKIKIKKNHLEFEKSKYSGSYYKDTMNSYESEIKRFELKLDDYLVFKKEVELVLDVNQEKTKTMTEKIEKLILYSNGKCPNCGTVVYGNNHRNYCGFCGVEIKWNKNGEVLLKK